ncbi:conserved hypothetical protein [Burkholderia cenocepacia]|nr:conserved hypothetical protein [Burkholderia cenocepacia]
MQGCQTARRLRATQSSVAGVLKATPGGKTAARHRRDAARRDTKRAEISVFRRTLHSRLQVPQSLVGREFDAVRGGSERNATDRAKCAQMTTFE